MQRVMEPKKSILTNIFDNYHIVRSRPNLYLYPQMPLKQISHYIKQAVRREQTVVIQLNPTPFSKQATEILGEITLSPHSSHIILKTDTEKTVHLIQPQNIRHLRLG